jgi:DNA-binding MarR family transcriptional regulator
VSEQWPADNVLLQTFRTVDAVRELMAEVVSDAGVTPDEWAVLSSIGVLGPISPSDLASRLRIPPTTISRHVAGLVEAAFATRSPNPADGRSYLLELTPRGRGVVTRVAPRMQAALDGLAERAAVDRIAAALVELERAARDVVDTAAVRQ